MAFGIIFGGVQTPNDRTERPALAETLDMQTDSQIPVTCKPGATAAVRSSDLVRRLNAHIAMMATHHKERYAGKLLIEATAEIRKLQTALCDLMPYVLEDYYPNSATPGYKAAVEAAKALTPNRIIGRNRRTIGQLVVLALG